MRRALYKAAAGSHASFVHRFLSVLGCGLLGFAASACASESLDAAGSSSGGSGGTGGRSGLAKPPAAIELTPLYEARAGWSATALGFNPLQTGELWVTIRQPPVQQLCTEATPSSCSALIGQIALVQAATSESPQVKVERDGNAWHFMRRPTSIAFGENGNFATCGEARTDNFEDEAGDYSGPALWSSDPAIFGVKPLPGQNGTHIDMLHETPFCMGMAYERENAYFAFNGKLGSVDRYDFRAPHVVGGEDHSDGELRRYVEGQLLRVPEVPSHMALDRGRGELYVADTGHARVARLSVDSGVLGSEIDVLEPMALHRNVDGAMLADVVAPGVLTLPSGIVFVDDVLIVTDNATSKLWWFKRDGTPLGSVDSGLPPGSLAGIALGPDQRLYLSDLKTARAFRAEPR